MTLDIEGVVDGGVGKLMRKLLKKQGYAPNKVVTDKLPSYGAALRDRCCLSRSVQTFNCDLPSLS